MAKKPTLNHERTVSPGTSDSHTVAAGNETMDSAHLATIPDLFFDRCALHPHRPAHFVAASGSRTGQWDVQSWDEYGRSVRRVAASLISCGIGPADRVAILGSNRPEWIHVDMAAMTVGAVPLGIYTSAAPEQVRYILKHSGARLLVLEDEGQFAKVESSLEELADLGTVVMMPGVEPRSPAVTSWEEFLDGGSQVPPREVDERRRRLRPDELGTLVYTSGTTGPPKAVMLSHRNLVAATRMGVQAIVRKEADDCTVSYLPLAHVAERGISLLGPVAAGYGVYFCADLEHLPRYLRDVRPTIFVGVPRLWEKMHEAITDRLESGRGLAARLGRWALGPVEPGTADAAGARAMARRMLIAPRLRKSLGLDRAHTAISGSAPIDPAIVGFFGTVGIEIREIYGLSECGGPATFVRPGRVRAGRVGQPFEGVELRVAADDEILIRGDHVFMGYLDDPSASQAAVDDGWLRSGDLGELDEQGSLRITGRKKEMIITAGGKNIAPRHIEALIAKHRLVRDVIVVGDGKKYLTALLTLTGHAETDQDLADKREQEVEAHVDDVNRQLARVEQIKRFCILPHHFSEQSGELTPTRKLRRSFVCQKYAAVIDRLYDSNTTHLTGRVPYDSSHETRV